MPDGIFNSNDEHKRLSMKVKNDVFYEMAVNNPTSGASMFFGAYMALFIVCAVCSFALLFFGFGSILSMLLAIVCAALSAFFYTMAQNARVEYDYTFTNGTLDIAKILNEKKRKKVASIDVTAILEMKPITSDAFQAHFENRKIRKVNLFLNRGEHLYYMLFIKDEEKVIVVFEPDQRMLECMKMFNQDNIEIG